MHFMTLLHKTFEKELPSIHKTRLQTMMEACTAAVSTQTLSLTGLGRHLLNKNKMRSNIQKMDRLLKNPHLHSERESMYKVMASYLIQPNSTPWIHVDWTCINAVTNLYALRASLSMSGRSIVLYEVCHPKEKENNHAIHKAFLNELKALLPASVKPVIVTDAGFRAPWFAYVKTLGWDLVGRLRHSNAVQLAQQAHWQLSQTFYPQATNQPTCLGSGLLTRKQAVCVHFVLYQGKSKHRHKLNKNKEISRASKSKRFAKACKEPWLLVTSLPGTDENMAKQAVTIYKQRMRIEENIRDTKCPHYGLGLKKSLSRTPQRMAILLLIAAIATFAAWLAGLYITHKGKAADYQAHSTKFKNALSKVYLGRQVLKKVLHISKKQFNNALKALYLINRQTQAETLI